MKREIKFRGISIDSKKWLYSNGFMKHKDGTIIMITKQREDDLVTEPIVSESLSQFTGLVDKNGTDIYENDMYSQQLFIGDKPDTDFEEVFRTTYHIVEYSEGVCNIGFQFLTNPLNIEIIGNIHENPELLTK